MPVELDSCEWLKVTPVWKGDDIDGVEVNCAKGRQLNDKCRRGPRLDCDYYRRAIGLTLAEVKAKYADEGNVE